jgi:(S)-ureidoglycine aminohydrolase
MQPSGLGRSVIRRNHALITPDSHVLAPRYGWQQTQTITLISPELGARFCQYWALMEPGGLAGVPLPGIERFLFVAEGTVQLDTGVVSELGVGGYAYLPPDVPHNMLALVASKLIVFERRYQPLPGSGTPYLVSGHEQDVVGVPFLGDPDALLKTLLPIEFAFDLAVNLFTFNPGAALPLVEVHVMEHGLAMLQGGGIYRLDDCWYPVQADDTIWMASYCPQWFGALGKTPARYLYYKDIHRDPLATN